MIGIPDEIRKAFEIVIAEELAGDRHHQEHQGDREHEDNGRLEQATAPRWMRRCARKLGVFLHVNLTPKQNGEPNAQVRKRSLSQPPRSNNAETALRGALTRV